MLPDSRLQAVASLVRDGARFADIGTDHAYLPIHLLESGRILSAVAADVAEGPLLRARRNVEEAGLSDKITLLLADGLTGMDDLGLTDIAICGMGGELIASILSAAPFVRDGRVRLILQPMTRTAELRQYLAKEGFAVLCERYAVAAGRAYTCLCVTYSGTSYPIDPVTAVLGTSSLRDERDTVAYAAFLDEREREARARIRGRLAGGADIGGDEILLAAIAAEREKL